MMATCGGELPATTTVDASAVAPSESVMRSVMV